MRDAVEAVLSAPDQGLAPLYGIAVDLTPFDVVRTAAPAIDVPFTRSAHAMPDRCAAGRCPEVHRSNHIECPGDWRWPQHILDVVRLLGERQGIAAILGD